MVVCSGGGFFFSPPSFFDKIVFKNDRNSNFSTSGFETPRTPLAPEAESETFLEGDGEGLD